MNLLDAAEGLTGLDIDGSDATGAAIAAQDRATKEANATQRYMYDTTRADLQPWREAGLRALGGLENKDFQKDFTMADFNADPGYAFRMAEGQKAIARAASAKGMFSSGTLKSLSRFNQDTASNEYQNAYNRFNGDRDRRFNRLASLAGIGQTATTQTANAATNYGNNVSANQIGMGNGVAAANIAQANRMSNLYGQGIAGGAMIASSDMRVKTNIEPISKSDLQEMKRHLKAYKFNYTSPEHGEGDWIGVMAQDLEKSKLGKTLVVENEDGVKQIDIRKVMCLFLATMAEG